MTRMEELMEKTPGYVLVDPLPYLDAAIEELEAAGV